jgi:hypothetical protein
MEIVNGNPAISYYDATWEDLMYVRALDADGRNWGTPIRVDVNADVGAFSSLQIVNGSPAISYFDAAVGGLKYVRANDRDGNTWGTPIKVDSIGYTGEFISLQIVNGNPAISYYNVDKFTLNYVRANDINGNSWGTIKKVDAGGGYYTSMQVIAGKPAISYFERVGNLKYCRALDANGDAWATPLIIDRAGYWSKLLTVNGNPAIAFYDYQKYDLKYIRATDSTGSTWGTAIAIDTTGDMGNWPSMQIVNGYPAISYGEENPNRMYLRYIRAKDVNGNAWGTPLTIDSTTNRVYNVNLLMTNGSPAVSYYDAGNVSLKFLRSNLNTSINVAKALGVKVFPSIFSDILTIESTVSNIEAIDIVNVNGQVLLSKGKTSNFTTLNTHTLPNGLYVIRIRLLGDLIVTEKLIKQ